MTQLNTNRQMTMEDLIITNLVTTTSRDQSKLYILGSDAIGKKKATK